MENKPRISVITAVYNGADHISECIESVRSQTFTDYEHIIVNDSSTDATGGILEEWRQKDTRIKILTNKENRGRAISRNRAITRSDAPLLAVLDADDYSFPERLAIQCDFLNSHPEIAVLGGDMLIHGSNERLTHPADNADIRAGLFFDSCLFHSTVMMRKAFLTKHRAFYRENLPLAQDYGLWAELMTHQDVAFANLHVPLTSYRLPDAPRPGYRERQLKFANDVRADILRELGMMADRETMAAHLAMLFSNAEYFGVTQEQCQTHGEKLLAANRQIGLTTNEALERHIAHRLKRLSHNYQR